MLSQDGKIILVVFLLLLSIFIPLPVLAVNINPNGKTCGNGVCQPSQNEDALTCPVDCASIITPTPTFTPTSTPTPAPTNPPVSTPTPQPTSMNTPTPQPTSISTPTPEPNTSINPTPTPQPSTTQANESSDTSTKLDSSQNVSPDNSTAETITYFPKLIITGPSSPTNKTSLFYTGIAIVENSTIALVEYSFTNGAEWIKISPQDGSYDNFSFTIPELSDGEYTIIIRAKSSQGIYTKDSDYFSQTLTIATVPPEVRLDIPATPLKDTSPTITGSIKVLNTQVKSVEISLNGGESWQPLNVINNRFSFTADELEDGNYQIAVRVIDTAGNTTIQRKTLIVDTIPPVIGGGMLELGVLQISPDQNGKAIVSANTNTTLTVSMKGGVTEAKVIVGEKKFPLTNIKGTNLWQTTIRLEDQGEGNLVFQAKDGAGNESERVLSKILVTKSGKVDSSSKQAINKAKVAVFVYSDSLKKYILWDGTVYNQQNPLLTDASGEYSFTLPFGKYYIEISKPGYQTTQSEIFNLDKTSIINANFTLFSVPSLTLPIGNQFVVSPSFFLPPHSESINLDTSRFATEKNEVSLPQNYSDYLSGDAKELVTKAEQPILLVFLSPWSRPSLEQLPILENVYSKTNPNISIVFLQEKEATAKTFMMRGKYNIPYVVDKNGDLAKDLGITYLPEFYLISPDKKVIKQYTGVMSENEINTYFGEDL